jgi:hypothetical protein
MKDWKYVITALFITLPFFFLFVFVVSVFVFGMGIEILPLTYITLIVICSFWLSFVLFLFLALFSILKNNLVRRIWWRKLIFASILWAIASYAVLNLMFGIFPNTNLIIPMLIVSFLIPLLFPLIRGITSKEVKYG